MFIKNSVKTLKHVAIGIAGGTILWTILCCMFACKNKSKNKMSRAVHSLGNLIEQIPCIFG